MATRSCRADLRVSQPCSIRSASPRRTYWRGSRPPSSSSAGAAVIAGAFVALASIPLAVVLLTALFTIHLRYGFFSVKLVEVTATGTRFGTVGYEIILLYLAGLSMLAAGGAGRLSIDRWLADRCGRRPWPGRA